MLDETLQINISVTSDMTSESLEIQQPDYPIEALRQLARSAVMHCSYKQTNAPVKVYWFSDRIEISNLGGLFDQVNRPADGAIGSHVTAVKNVYWDFKDLAQKIATRTGLPMPYLQSSSEQPQ